MRSLALTGAAGGMLVAERTSLPLVEVQRYRSANVCAKPQLAKTLDRLLTARD